MTARPSRSGMPETVEEADPLVSLEPAFERLVYLAGLGPDWDSYGGAPPTVTAIARAGHLVVTVARRFRTSSRAAIKPFAIMPIADGGVQLEWRGADEDLELDIGPAGAIGYLLVDRRRGERRFEEGDDLSWPEALGLVERVLH
jgi:hypothetical protein